MDDYKHEPLVELNDEDDGWVLTPKGIFYCSLNDAHIIEISDNFLENKDIENAYLLFEYWMKKYGYYMPNGEKVKNNNKFESDRYDPITLFKKAIRGVKIDCTPEELDIAWDLFCIQMERHGYLKEFEGDDK